MTIKHQVLHEGEMAYRHDFWSRVESRCQTLMSLLSCEYMVAYGFTQYYLKVPPDMRFLQSDKLELKYHNFNSQSFWFSLNYEG